MKNVIFKVLGKIKWEDIAVGKIFGWDGCFTISMKTSEKTAFHVATDYGEFGILYEESDFCPYYQTLYELPESVQELFITK